MTRTRKQLPLCEGCGHYTCTDCGEGFASVEAYLRHRTDTAAHAARGDGVERADA